MMRLKSTIKKVIPRQIFRAGEPYGHLGESVFLQIKHGFPANNLKIIGVTGTNGKTTTCFMIHRMLVNAGIKTGLMTTVANGINDDITMQEEHMTTPPAGIILKRLKKMNDAGVEWVVLETTSHALAQHRVWGINYSIAVMTNVTLDHLDYHGTFANYLKAKIKLFKLTNSNLKGFRLGIINAEDPNASEFKKSIKNSITYGVESGDVRSKNIKYSSSGSSFLVETNNEKYDLKINVPGSFNVYNALAAVCVGKKIGLNKKQIQDGLRALDGVSGRMTSVEAGQNFAVIVDFAHTPDALERVLLSLQKTTTGKVRVVFGATGDRDKTKRPIMGDVTIKNADMVYLTDDETHTEDGATIRLEVRAGIENAGGIEGKTFVEIADRLEAIKQAFKDAKPGDAVLLAGLGHQDYRAMDGKKMPWDEVQVAKKLLKKAQDGQTTLAK